MRLRPVFSSLRLYLVFTLLLAAAPGCSPPDQRPNFVVIMTDDQRWDEVAYMPTVSRRLADEGLRFTNSFVTTPLCCPSRASLLSGKYAHNHGIMTLGGAPLLDTSSTIAVWLSGAGYRTGLVGKYMNQNGKVAPAVPPGWDTWRTFVDMPQTFSGDWLYFDYTLNQDGHLRDYGKREEDYSTDVLRRMAVEFIRKNADRPFFLLFTPFAPHTPPRPAPRHQGALSGVMLKKPPSFLEADMSDKPSHTFPKLPTPEDRAAELAQHTRRVDEHRVPTLESLLAVDEAVAEILDTLQELGISERTVVVFTSDNGFMYGEHWMVAKLWAYEESARVPLLIRYPEMVRQPRDDDRLVVNIDLAPTIAELAGVAIPGGVDGQSLVPLLKDRASDWRKDVLIEFSDPSRPLLSYAAVRSERWKYVYRDHNGFEELYDLESDPFEMANLLVTRNDDDTDQILERMRERLRELRGSGSTPVTLPR